MTGREKVIFAPLVAMTILLGVYPSLVTNVTGPAVQSLLSGYDQRVAEYAASTAVASNGGGH